MALTSNLLTVALGGMLLQNIMHPFRHLLLTLTVGEWHADGFCACEFQGRWGLTHAKVGLQVACVLLFSGIGPSPDTREKRSDRPFALLSDQF